MYRSSFSKTSSSSVMGVILTAIVLFAVLILISGAVFMACWNFVVPYLFALPAINFAQALVLSLLISTIGSLLKGVTNTNVNKKS
jgi:hypothetical protein